MNSKIMMAFFGIEIKHSQWWMQSTLLNHRSKLADSLKLKIAFYFFNIKFGNEI
jgi:hypothetical protein